MCGVKHDLLSIKKRFSQKVDVILAGCLVPTKPLYHSPPQQDMWGQKVRWKKSRGSR